MASIEEQMIQQQVRQLLLNEALYRLLLRAGGEITFPSTELSQTDMGGINIKIDTETKEVTLEAVSHEVAAAMYEAQDEIKQ